MKGMSQYFIVCLLVLVLILSFAGPAYGVEGISGSGITGPGSGIEGPGIPGPTPSEDKTPSSGSSTRRLTLDSFINYLESWQRDNPTKYKQMVKHLVQGVPLSPKPPYVSLYYNGSNSVNREDILGISCYVINNNTLDQRTNYWLYLEAKEEGQDSFKKITPTPLIIQPFSYKEDDKWPYYFAKWPEISSFGELIKLGILKNKIGEIKLRASLTDGVNTFTSDLYIWDPPYYGELKLNLTNNPPILSNFSIESNYYPPGYKDRIEYLSNLTDKDGDLVNITLHVIDSDGKERKSVDQTFRPGEKISFQAAEHGFFDKNDAGKNFTYYYTYGDGIDINKTPIQDGPRLKRSTAIWVDNPRVIPEDENQYWWQSYNFSIDMKNQDQGEAKVSVMLFVDTSTSGDSWKYVDSKDVVLTQEQKTVHLNVKPFSVTDAKKPFRFRFNYTDVYDQHGNDYMVKSWPKLLNAKLVKYDLISAFGLANMLAIIISGLMLSILIERRFYR